jgi:SAM-dependent methyltransferase
MTVGEETLSLDKNVLRAFWERMAQKTDNRWTPSNMFDWEVSVMSELAPDVQSILDLGSGHGKLSRQLLKDGGRLLAVDWIDKYKDAFEEPNQQFVCSGLTSFDTDEQFDLVLLFGVVTCLEEAEERKMYENMDRHLKPGGHAVVKNQCSNKDEFVVNGYSEDLGSQYSARYPAIEEQKASLGEHFSNIETIRYPAEFNRWDNSSHILFFVSN